MATSSFYRTLKLSGPKVMEFIDFMEESENNKPLKQLEIRHGSNRAELVRKIKQRYGKR